jgi:hypothetical protein
MIHLLQKLAKTIIVMPLILILVASMSCSSNQPLEQSMWTYAPDAITVNYTASLNLNFSQMQPHTLLLAVIQTAQLQNIQSFLQNPQGISLLLNKKNDPNQVQNYYITKIFINPGDKNHVKLTRMASMQTVVLVAGYNQLNPGQVIKIFDIPVAHPWFSKDHPKGIKINVNLGEQGILNADYDTT